MSPQDALLIAADWLITFALLKATLITLIAALAAVLLAKREPALRAAVWSGAFAALLVAPATALIAPKWTAQVVAFPVQLWRTGVDGAPVDAASGALPLAIWLFAVWLAVALLRLVRIGRDIGAVRTLERGATAIVDPRVHALLDDARTRLRVRRPIRIATSDDIAGPVSFGWLRPVVLLPRDTATWPDDRVAAVLLHEVAHIRRGDWAVLIGIETLAALHWFNPLIAWMARRVRGEQDRACDLAAVRLGGVRAPDYARHLVDVARSLRPARDTPITALPVLGRSGLEGRVRAILQPARAGSTTVLIAALFLALLFGFGIGGAQLWRCDAQPAAAHPPAPLS